MDILHAQFNHGHLSLEEVRTVLGSDFGSSWPALQKKFSVDATGNFFNERLEQEQVKRKNFCISRRNNLNNPHKEEHMKPHMEPHMENENRNRNKDKKPIKKGVKKFIPPSLDEFQEYFKENDFPAELAERAWKGYDAAGWKDSQGNEIKSWKQKCQHVWFKDSNKDQGQKEKTAPSKSEALLNQDQNLRNKYG